MAAAAESIQDVTRLHFKLYADSPSECVPTPESVAKLQSLAVKLYFSDAHKCFSAMQAIRAIILGSPELRELKLEVAHVECGSFGQSGIYSGLNFSHGDRLPGLTSLKLIGYPFGRQREEHDHGFVLNSEGYTGEGPEIDFWMDGLNDWSCLRSLVTDYSHFAKGIMPKLTSLEEANLLPGFYDEQMASFFSEVPTSLHKIQTPSLACASLEGIIRHGGTLTHLKIHESDIHIKKADWSERAVDLPSLQLLRRDCPNMRNLSIDIPRSGVWPYKAFDIIKSFPALVELEIWFELAPDSENPVKPFLTHKAAEHIFRYFIDDGDQASDTLCTLTLRCGDYSPRTTVPWGFPAPESYWHQYNRTAFRCERRNSSKAQADSAILTTNLLLPARHQIDQSEPSAHASPVEFCKSDSRKAMSVTERPRDLLMRIASKWRHRASKPGFVHSDALLHVKERLDVAERGPCPFSQWEAHY